MQKLYDHSNLIEDRVYWALTVQRVEGSMAIGKHDPEAVAQSLLTSWSISTKHRNAGNGMGFYNLNACPQCHIMGLWGNSSQSFPSSSINWEPFKYLCLLRMKAILIHITETCMSLYIPHMCRCPQRPEGIRIVPGCELPDTSAGNQPWVLCKGSTRF